MGDLESCCFDCSCWTPAEGGHGDGYEDVRKFWVMRRALRKFPDLDEKEREV
jgi:hypothetical protein